MLKRFVVLAVLVGLAVGCQNGASHKPSDSGAGAAAASTEYFEMNHDGRIYVIGSKESKAKFQQSGHMPYARTLVGQGPGGETVVIEISKDDPELVDRLEKKFRSRHGL